MIITDLYLPQAEAPGAALEAVPGIELVGRFGARRALADGWRPWLARWLGHEDLAQAAPASIAAASLTAPAGAAEGGAAMPAATRWIATPVELVAGLSSVHLGQRGIVRLAPPERMALCDAFARTFGGSGLKLWPLSGGDFLMETPGIEPLATPEPARCLGAQLAAYLPRGAAAPALLRLASEIEMWLHGEPLNAARRARGVQPVTQLWLWGSAGGPVPARPPAQPAADLAFGDDAYLAGLWHLQGAACRELPRQLEPLLEQGSAVRAVLGVEAGGELLYGESAWRLDAALAALDRRFVSPALRALEAGMLGRLLVVANDTCVSLTRLSTLKRWRLRRAPLAPFA
jgi:hypothetical protein